MRIRNLAIIAGAAAIATAPLAAQARDAAPVTEADEIGGMNGLAGAALGVAVGAALIYGLIELTDDEEDEAVSA